MSTPPPAFLASLNSGRSLESFLGSDHVTWQCQQGHNWEAEKRNVLKRGTGCPFCINRRVWPGFNDLATLYPEVAITWDESLNDVSPSEVLPASTAAVFWICGKGHSWQASPRNRVKSGGCLICSNKEVLAGYNDLATTHPHLASEWHPDRNSLQPTEVLSGSAKRVWWLGLCGHEWETITFSRTNGSGCPDCARTRITTGLNTVQALAPEMAKQWHLLNRLSPDEIGVNSQEEVLWQALDGHTWATKVQTRLNQPLEYCRRCRLSGKSTRTVAVGYPQLVKEWSPKNELKPEEALVNRVNSYWWVCPKGHERKSTPRNRLKADGSLRRCNPCYLENNNLGLMRPKVAALWDTENNHSLNPSDVTFRSAKRVAWVCEKDHKWMAQISVMAISPATGCPECVSQTSSGEKALIEWLKSVYSGEIKLRHRKLLGGLEVDIYLPDAKLAVEYNGVYWHSEEKGKDRTYHALKHQRAAAKGVQLLQVWEDEWNCNPELVKRMLAHKLGVSSLARVAARRTQVVELSVGVAREFLDEYHIQGFGKGFKYLGLVPVGEPGVPVAVLVLKREPSTDGKVLNIIRYATSVTVVGGFTKLLKFAERNYSPDSFITFADHMVSDGGLYANNGFVVDKVLRPDYRYVVAGQRVHKFNYRLSRFRDDPGLKFVEGLSESELAALNKIPRVWDAGKTRYVKYVT